MIHVSQLHKKVLPLTLGFAEAWAGVSAHGKKSEQHIFLNLVSKWQLPIVQMARLEKQSAHCAYRWVHPLSITESVISVFVMF